MECLKHAHNKAKQWDNARGGQIAITLRCIFWQFGHHAHCPCWRRYVAMSLFDTYIPANILNCSVCGEKISEWQGKDGPCGSFVWCEKKRVPIAQNAADSNLAVKDKTKITLPEQFEIYSYDCNCQYPVQAIGTCKEQTWIRTILVTSENAVQHKDERKSDFEKRLRWLRGEAT